MSRVRYIATNSRVANWWGVVLPALHAQVSVSLTSSVILSQLDAIQHSFAVILTTVAQHRPPGTSACRHGLTPTSTALPSFATPPALLVPEQLSCVDFILDTVLGLYCCFYRSPRRPRPCTSLAILGVPLRSGNLRCLSTICCLISSGVPSTCVHPGPVQFFLISYPHIARFSHNAYTFGCFVYFSK